MRDTLISSSLLVSTSKIYSSDSLISFHSSSQCITFSGGRSLVKLVAYCRIFCNNSSDIVVGMIRLQFQVLLARNSNY